VEERKIFSLNKCAYLLMIGRNDYKIQKETKDEKEIFYLIFDKDVSEEIGNYMRNALIQEYNHSYKSLRNQINMLRGQE
jgi:hypothetical protein